MIGKVSCRKMKKKNSSNPGQYRKIDMKAMIMMMILIGRDLFRCMETQQYWAKQICLGVDSWSTDLFDSSLKLKKINHYVFSWYDVNSFKYILSEIVRENRNESIIIFKDVSSFSSGLDLAKSFFSPFSLISNEPNRLLAIQGKRFDSVK